MVFTTPSPAPYQILYLPSIQWTHLMTEITIFLILSRTFYTVTFATLIMWLLLKFTWSKSSPCSIIDHLTVTFEVRALVEKKADARHLNKVKQFNCHDKLSKTFILILQTEMHTWSLLLRLVTLVIWGKVPVMQWETSNYLIPENVLPLPSPANISDPLLMKSHSHKQFRAMP